MPCEHIRLPNGTGAIICSGGRTQRCGCGRRAERLCDWKVPTRRSGTCDRPVCSRCSVSPAPEKDLCPEHARAFDAWRASRAQPSHHGAVNE